MRICWENVNRDLATLIATSKHDGGCSDCQIKVDKERLHKLKGYVEGVIDYINWLNDYSDDDEDDTDEHDAIRERIYSMLDRLYEEQEEEEQEENETTEVTIAEISEEPIDEIIEKLEMAKRGEVEITKLTFEGRVTHE